MLTALIAQLKAALFSSQNQFLSGGLVLGMLGGLTYSLKALPGRMWQWLLYHYSVVLEVQSTDQAYQWLLLWAESQPYTTRARRIALRDVQMKNRSVDDKTAVVPARGNHWFFYHGLPVWLHRGKDADAAPSGGMSGGMAASANMAKEVFSIRTLGRKRTRINGIMAEAQALYESVSHDKLAVRFRRWGEWEIRLRAKRPLDSIFLAQKNTILADMQRFLAAETWYRTMGLPFRRGYLFHGVAGAGKTTLAETLAGALNLDLYVINIATQDNNQLEHALSEIDTVKPIMLLIEDIDTVSTSRATEEPTNAIREQPPKLTLGTLLNVLDGLAAIDRVIVVMTTNYQERLDPALKRKGRVDVDAEFTHATDAQIMEAAQRFLGTISATQMEQIAKWERPITMADAQELLRSMVWNQVDEQLTLRNMEDVA